MITGTATIANKAGIHVRPSGVIFSEMKDYNGTIALSAKGMRTDLKSVMGLIALGLQVGDTVEIEVTGPGEEGACTQLIELLERVYDFPPRNA